VSKEEQVLKALQRGERLTPLDALKRYGIFTLSQRVSEWRRQGKPIRDRYVDGAKHKEYWWEPQERLIA
jgi:hypothetical protein